LRNTKVADKIKLERVQRSYRTVVLVTTSKGLSSYRWRRAVLPELEAAKTALFTTVRPFK
jgi:hypothetical protein